MAPAGSVSILRRPADIFSTVSAHSLKMRWKFDDAGCVDCPFNTMGLGRLSLGWLGKGGDESEGRSHDDS